MIIICKCYHYNCAETLLDTSLEYLILVSNEKHFLDTPKYLWRYINIQLCSCHEKSFFLYKII